MQALKHGRGSAGRGPSALDNALVAFQVSLCLVLVVAAGLFVRTFIALTGQDPGVDRERVIVVAVDARHSPQASANRTALYDRMRQAGRLLHSNWDLYDTRHVVYRPAKLGAEELEAGYWRAYPEF